jgi:hypothetical protein
VTTADADQLTGTVVGEHVRCEPAAAEPITLGRASAPGGSSGRC